MVPEFEKACFENPVGSALKVKTEFGWHVIAILQQGSLPKNMSVEELGAILVGFV